jgi:hypothetical protein
MVLSKPLEPAQSWSMEAAVDQGVARINNVQCFSPVFFHNHQGGQVRECLALAVGRPRAQV